ncbi:cytochrome P460 family protein [Arhodomonas sp. AD133]|uniref:cytochrome P460 family protein n=1 Tax=Arhodomonas sp. AD133 TaxID=3415009 RepID=UPI003EBDFA84
MRVRLLRIALVTAAALPMTAMTADQSFGTDADVAYSQQLWEAMAEQGLVGEEALMSTPYEGQHPHGAVLDTIDTTFTLDDNTGELIIKRNYGGEGVSKTAVANEPGEWLQSVTVMYRRDGYDADNADWFWVKYQPDGSPATNPKGMPLAGRVAKGADQGCIACHQAAPGGDYVYNHDRF